MRSFVIKRMMLAVGLSLAAGAGQAASLADNGNGTLTDSDSGLMWLRCAVGQTWSGTTCSGSPTTYTWWNATALNGTVNFARASDWRVPTLDELKTLGSAVDATNFPNNYQDSFWSATDDPTYQAGDYAYEIYYAYAGATGQQYLDRKRIGKYVRLVRGPVSVDPVVPEPPGNTTDPTTPSGSRLSISFDEMAGMITNLQPPVDTPTAFFDTDPLGMAGVSLMNASAQYAGDTLRLINVSIGEQSSWLDFTLNVQSGRFVLNQAGSNYPGAVQRNDLPGMDTASAPVIAAVMGPPLKADVVPFKLGTEYYGATLAFDTASLSFGVESTRAFSQAAVDVLKGETRASTRATSDAITSWVAQQGLVDTQLKSGTDWEQAALTCATKLIDRLNIGSVGGKALQMMAADGPEVFQGMREALLLGNPDDASLIFSQLAWKALANNVSSGNELADTLKAISEKAGYVQAGAQAAGAACSFDYKQALENLLGGALTTAFPLSACAMELGTNALKAGRTAINNTIQQNLYKLWKSYGDDVFDYGVQRGVDALLGSLARQRFGHNTDFEVKYADYVSKIETELKVTFAQWHAAENAAGPTVSRLQAHQTAYDSWGMTSQQRLNERLFDGQGSEVEVFKRYIAMKQMYRARLAGFMPKGTSAAVLDSYAEIAMDAYLDPPAGKTPKAAAQAVIAEQIRKWNPDLFEQEPAVCELGASGGDLELGSMSLIYDMSKTHIWLENGRLCDSYPGTLKGSYSFGSSGTSGQNYGYVTSSNGTFTADCSNANCFMKSKCEGTLSGSASSNTLRMTCSLGTTTVVVSGTNGQLRFESGTGMGETYNGSEYVSCSGLPVSGTISGGYGVYAAP